MRWVLNAVYAALLIAVSPVIAWRSLRHGRYRRGWREKLFGQLPKSASGQRVAWFHAVSVGEVLQLEKVVAAFQARTGNQFQVIVTTSTDTGFELATERFHDCAVTWFPLDFSWAVSTALQRVKPEVVVLFELELWPNFLKECTARGIQTALVNARLSERSYRGYARIRSLIQPVFAGFSAVGAQTQEYSDRLCDLGCQPQAVQVTGSVKFDGVLTDRCNDQTAKLRSLFGIRPDDMVLIAGSTQDPEEMTALNAWQRLRKSYPDLRLIIVPRHRERFEAVVDLIVRSGSQAVRRSQLSAQTNVDPEAVIVLDTIGELGACWGLADIAFVGGSFGSRGGQNVLEPAAYGAAVMFGPNTWNFKEIVLQLKKHDAAIQLPAPEDLAPHIGQLIEDPPRRRRLGQNAQQFVHSQQGAIDRTASLLGDLVLLQPATRAAA